MSVLGIAGTCALISASFRDVPGAVVGLLAAGAGAIELHGATLLRAGDPRGVRWLPASQLCLMVTLLGYVAFQLSHPADLDYWRKLITPDVAQVLQQQGMTVEQFVVGIRALKELIYMVVGAATVLFQGAMMLYYARRSAAVEAALDGDHGQ
jgi:hypothetical protein